MILKIFQSSSHIKFRPSLYGPSNIHAESIASLTILRNRVCKFSLRSLCVSQMKKNNVCKGQRENLAIAKLLLPTTICQDSCYSPGIIYSKSCSSFIALVRITVWHGKATNQSYGFYVLYNSTSLDKCKIK